MPAWKDTPARQAILDFLEASSDAAASNFIPPNDRIAAFDNDGTLWVEQPAPAQVGMLLGELIERVKSDPSLAEQDPYEGIITQDPAFMTALAQQGSGGGAVLPRCRGQGVGGHLT